MRNSVLLALSLLPSLIIGQQTEQPTVRSIRIVVLPPTLPDGKIIPVTKRQIQRTKRFVLANILTKVGQKFSPHRFDADLKRLLRLRRFLITPSLHRKDGQLDITLRIRLLPIARKVLFLTKKGEEVTMPEEVTWVLSAQENEYVNPFMLNHDARFVNNHLIKEGYPFSKVSWRLKAFADGVKVEFVLDYGMYVGIGAITFVGNKSFDSDTLYGHIESREETFLRRIFGGGEFVEKQLKDDARRLTIFLRNQGFLDASVRVKWKIKKVSSDKGVALVTFYVDEGQRYKVRDVRFSGQFEISPEKIRQLVTIKRGDFLNQEALQDSADAIRRELHRRGHVAAKVVPEWTVGVEGDTVGVVFRIYAGPVVRIRRVIIRGNTMTRDKVIRRELSVFPGAICDLNELRTSLNRLYRLRYFSFAFFDLLDTDDPAYKDLLVEVEETRAGRFEFGFQYSQEYGFQGRLALVHPNVDISRWPPVGGGQHLQLEFRPGRAHSRYFLFFLEPYLFNTKIRFRIRPEYRRDRWWDYNEKTASFSFGFGRAITRYISLDATLSLERTTVYNISSNAPLDVFLVQGTRDLYGLGMEGVIDLTSVDRWGTVYSGIMTRLSFDIFGKPLPSDYNFWRGVIHAQAFINLYETDDSTHIVWSFRATGALARPYAGDDFVPIFERFFAGGSLSAVYGVRGFHYRYLGPTEKGSPLGGTAFLLFSTELSTPIPGVGKNLRFALFVDTANLAYTKSDFYIEDFRISCGFGFRIRVQAFFTIRFDFAWPLRILKGDVRQTFQFSMGANF